MSKTKIINVRVDEETYEKIRSLDIPVSDILRMGIQFVITLCGDVEDYELYSKLLILDLEEKRYLSLKEKIDEYSDKINRELTKVSKEKERITTLLREKRYNEKLSELYYKLNKALKKYNYDLDKVRSESMDLIEEIKEIDPDFDLERHTNRVMVLSKSIWDIMEEVVNAGYEQP